ncbi:hypothetical protein ASE43_02345 [Lysobacter sp. Root983]|nr:hypothetical protein ASE43_02345 [Lysobacter sp. Root983]
MPMYPRGQVAQPDMDVSPPQRAERDDADLDRRGRDARGDSEDPAQGDAGESPDSQIRIPSDAISLHSLGGAEGKSSTLGITLLEYQGLPFFELTVKGSFEVGPSLSIDYVPSPSMLLDAKSLKEGSSFETPIPLPLAGTSLNFGVGMDGSQTIGLELGLGPKLGRASLGGAQVYAYTVCPDSGPCFDAGAKLKTGNITYKADVGVSLGRGFDVMADEIGRAIIRSLELPVPGANGGSQR